MASRLVVLLAFLCACGSSAPPDTQPPAAEGQLAGDGGVALYYRIAGRGADTLVMVHGGPGMDHGYMVADFAPLEERHRLIYYDQRGGGRSARPGSDPSLYTMERHVADLEALRRHFELERMTLVAHSYGPALAASYAMAHPDRVAKMIFIGPVPPRLGDLWARYTVVLEGQLTADERKRMAELDTAMTKGTDPVAACRAYWVLGIKARVARPDLAGKVKGDFCGAGADGIRHGYGVAGPHTWTALGQWDFRPGLRRVTAPVLIIHGEAEAIPMDLVEEWTTALPDGKLVKIAGASHFPYVERPDLVWPAIEEFLAAR